MSARISSLALLLLAARCSDPVAPPGPEPVDAGTQADCRAACDKLLALHCPEAEPTPDGGSCFDVCWNAESSGYVTINPNCVANATTCDGVEQCIYTAGTP